MNCEEARELFAGAWRRDIEERDEADLQRHLDSCEACRVEVEELRRVWDALGALPAAAPGAGLRTQFYGSLREWQRREFERKGPAGWLRHPWLQIAAALVLVAGGIAAGRVSALPGVEREESRLTDLQKEVNDMRQLVALSLLQQQSASERLKGVSWSYRVEQSDSEVLSALLHTLNSDSNVNVRLAVVDALRNFAVSPEARAGLSQALPRQSSPLVQVAILDQLVDLRERSSAPVVDSLLRQPDLSPEVRQRAEWAIRRLQ